MTTTGETITAMPASDVAFADDKIALGKSFYVIAGNIDNPDKFVADGHRHGNRLLGPGVPVIYMDVGPADRGFDRADEHVIAADLRNRNLFQPKTGLAFAFHDSLHRFLHEK